MEVIGSIYSAFHRYTTTTNFKVFVIRKIESNIPALVLLNLLNSLRKRDKMLSKLRILSLFLNWFNRFNKT